MIGRNLDDAEEWLRSWTAQASARAEAAQQMSDRVAGLTSTVTVADGAITAGHGPQHQHPEASAAHIATFVNKTSKPVSSPASCLCQGS